MNWVVHRKVQLNQRMINDADGVCEHVKVGDYCHESGEQDSFGPVARFYECDACYEAAAKAAGEEEVVCHDCRKVVLRKQIREWKPFDFYAPQGDTPLEICDCCWKAQRHQDRMLHDRQNEDAEYGETRY